MCIFEVGVSVLRTRSDSKALDAGGLDARFIQSQPFPFLRRGSVCLAATYMSIEIRTGSPCTSGLRTLGPEEHGPNGCTRPIREGKQK